MRLNTVPYDLDLAYAEWVEDDKPVLPGAPPFVNTPRNEWDVSKLHVTDVGNCLRQVCYRVSGAESRPLTPAEVKMFDVANYIHWAAVRSIEHRGHLIAEEVSLSKYLPKRWTGRLDVGRDEGGTLRIEDFKTVHPNWVNEKKKMWLMLPKDTNKMQVSIYWHHALKLAELYGIPLDELVGIHYMDRGGSNPSKSYVFEPIQFEVVKLAMAEVEETVLEYEVTDLLPPLLESRVRWGSPYSDKDGKQTGGSLNYGPPWNCRYCRIKDCPQDRESHSVGAFTKTFSWQKRKAVEAGELNVIPYGDKGFLFLNKMGRSFEGEVRSFINDWLAGVKRDEEELDEDE